jgi:hypothetical protein
MEGDFLSKMFFFNFFIQTERKKGRKKERKKTHILQQYIYSLNLHI